MLWRRALGTAILAMTLVLAPAVIGTGSRDLRSQMRRAGRRQLMNQIDAQRGHQPAAWATRSVEQHLENAQKRQRDMYLDLDSRMRRSSNGSADAVPKPDKAPVADTAPKRPCRCCARRCS
jgi:hypothetical protein